MFSMMASKDTNTFVSATLLCIALAKEDEYNMLFLNEKQLSLSSLAARTNLRTFGIFTMTKSTTESTSSNHVALGFDRILVTIH